jgi:hypothetical protein
MVLRYQSSRKCPSMRGAALRIGVGFAALFLGACGAHVRIERDRTIIPLRESATGLSGTFWNEPANIGARFGLWEILTGQTLREDESVTADYGERVVEVEASTDGQLIFRLRRKDVIVETIEFWGNLHKGRYWATTVRAGIARYIPIVWYVTKTRYVLSLGGDGNLIVHSAEGITSMVIVLPFSSPRWTTAIFNRVESAAEDLSHQRGSRVDPSDSASRPAFATVRACHQTEERDVRRVRGDLLVPARATTPLQCPCAEAPRRPERRSREQARPSES